MRPLLLAGIALAIAAPVSAQREVARRSFTFFDTNLTIEVLGGESGVLQVVRGGDGRVEVAARAPSGIPGFGLGGRDHNTLRLTATSERVEYLVIAPEDVRIRVRLPGKPVADVVSRRPAASYTWGEEPPEPPTVESMTSTPGGPYTSYYSSEVPREVILPDLASVRRLELRFEGSDFRVVTDQPSLVNSGRTDRLVLRGDARQPLSATLLLPRQTRDFTLSLGGKTALTVRGSEVRNYCEQFIRQQLADGGLVYTYHPSGTLRCR